MTPLAPPTTPEIQALEAELLEKSQRLAELKRAMPRERVEDATLAGWDGPVKLSELFGGKKELLMIHNMGKGCRYCTLWADGFNGVWRHLADRAGFVVCSPDPVETQRAFAGGRGWGFPMVSGHGSAFIQEMGFRDEKSWRPGVSTFSRGEDGTITRVATAEFGPYDLYCGVWHLIALLPQGENGWEPKYAYEAPVATR
jgi:predicted dithiol-disulfide oxidoreductase (DUF899 family)